MIAVIFALAGVASAQPAPPPLAPAPSRDALDVVVAPPSAPMVPSPAVAPIAPVAPAYAPGPPAWGPPPAQWGQPPPQWGPQPPPGYWPQYAPYAPAAPPSVAIYRQEQPFSLPPPVPKEPVNRKLMTAGIVAAVGGVATLITGSILMSVAKERVDVYRDGPAYCCSIDDAPMRNAGIATLVTGGIVAAIGIPLWMIGGRRVPVRKTTTEAPGAAPPKAPASLAPLLHVGATGGSLSWQF